MCVRVFLMDHQIALWMLISRSKGHLLFFSGKQKRTVSLAKSRVLMQGFHIFFLVKNVLPNKYHLVLAPCQGLGDELGASRTALPWRMSSRALLEVHSCRMTGGWLFLCNVSPEISGGWLLGDGVVVLYSLFHTTQKGAISEKSWGGQTAHVLPTCLLFYWETRRVPFSSFCSARSRWLSADIFPKWPC